MTMQFNIEFMFIREAEDLPVCKKQSWYDDAGILMIPESKFNRFPSRYFQLTPLCTTSYLSSGLEGEPDFSIEKMYAFKAWTFQSSENNWYLKMFFEYLFGRTLQNDAYYGLSDNIAKMVHIFSRITIPKVEERVLFMHYTEWDAPEDDDEI